MMDRLDGYGPARIIPSSWVAFAIGVALVVTFMAGPSQPSGPLHG